MLSKFDRSMGNGNIADQLKELRASHRLRTEAYPGAVELGSF